MWRTAEVVELGLAILGEATAKIVGTKARGERVASRIAVIKLSTHSKARWGIVAAKLGLLWCTAVVVELGRRARATRVSIAKSL